MDAGAAILSEVADEIRCERASRARLYYLASTILVAAAFLVIGLIAVGIIPTPIAATDELRRSIWHSVNAGVLGAVYSIALGIERRDVTNDRRRADHLTDALVRIAIGALAAFVLGNFLLTGAVQINFGNDIAMPAGEPAGNATIPWWPVTMIAGFLAGFAERLVPDLLNSYTIAGRTPPEPLTAVAPGLDKALAAEGGEPPVPESEEELDPPPSDEEHLDGCEVKLEPRRLFAHRTPIPAVPDRPTLPPFEVRQSDVGFQAIGE